MAVTVAATKTVSFRSPYTGATFQGLTSLLMGRDGYLSGGETSDDSVVVTVAPATILQRGIVATGLAPATGIAVPTSAEPWFLLAAIPDDDPDSGISFSVTADAGLAAASVVVAYKTNGRWTNSESVNVASALETDSDVGGEVDLGIADQRDVAGVVTSMSAYRGLVVDPSGKRRPLPAGASNTGRSLDQAPVRPSTSFDRNDHIVLRQVDAVTPEVKQIIGAAIGGSGVSILDSGVGVTRPAYFARRGGSVNQQWFAWGDAFALKILGGPTGGGFPLATLLSGGVMTSTVLPGQRASDSAVLLLYVDGINLRLVSFDAASGALVDAPFTLETLPGQISHARAVLDHNENLHVVFEHTEGGPHQQVYYTRRKVTAGAGFGLADIAPRIVNGSDTAANDTWPSIGVDSHGTITVAHIRGTGTNEFGDLVVATIDAAGNTVNQDLVFAAADVAIDSGNTGPVGLAGTVGTGAVGTAFLNVRTPAVVVTPHDETYVFTAGLSAGTRPDYLLAYEKGFGRELGFKLLNVQPQLVRLDAGLSTHGIVGLAADVGEAGQICVAFKTSSSAPAETNFYSLTLATPLLKSGRVPQPLQAATGAFNSSGTSDSFNDLSLRRGPLGEFAATYLMGSDAKFAPLALGAAGATMRHPKDLYLGTWSVPAAASATIDGHGKRFEVFNTRPKKMNYPIVVGQNGDFQGFGSYAEAIAQTIRLGGGEVVLRAGIHHVTGFVELLGGGASVRGEGAAVIVADFTGAAAIGASVRGTAAAGFAVTASGGVLTDTANIALDLARPGDVIALSSGEHVVLRNLGWHPSTGLARVLVENSAAGAPVAGTARLYASGVRFENLTIARTSADTSPLVSLGDLNRPVIRGVKLIGPSTASISVSDCLEIMVDGLDLTKVVNTAADASLSLLRSSGAVIRSAKFADGKGKLSISDDSQNVHLIGCSSDAADSTKVIYELAGTRTTPVFMSSCEGRVSGSAGSLAFLISNVGRRLRQPEGLGQLEFEDDNTRASTITDDGIKLSSATHKEFDGVSTDTITDAVNERVKVGGDTMTGPLVFAAGDARVKVAGDTMTGALTMGANILTDGTTRALGATGVAANRFEAFLDTVDALDLITAQAGLTASVNQHVTVSGTGRYKHGDRYVYVGAWDFVGESSAMSYATQGGYGNAGAAGHLVANVPLEAGKYLKTAQFFYSPQSVNSVTPSVTEVTYTTGGAGSPVVAGTADGTGSAIESQTLTVNTLITNTTYLLLRYLVVSGLNRIHGVLLTFTDP